MAVSPDLPLERLGQTKSEFTISIRRGVGETFKGYQTSSAAASYHTSCRGITVHQEHRRHTSRGGRQRTVAISRLNAAELTNQFFRCFFFSLKKKHQIDWGTSCSCKTSFTQNPQFLMKNYIPLPFRNTLAGETKQRINYPVHINKKNSQDQCCKHVEDLVNLCCGS